MKEKRYIKWKRMVLTFVLVTVVLGWINGIYVLAGSGLLIGLVFLAVTKMKKGGVDEREKSVREQATKIAYSIFAPTIGIGSFLLLLFSSGSLSTVKERFYYLQSLGVIFAYLTLFLIVLYLIAYYFLNKKYGGEDEK
ncbi:MAG: DUF2178 domain-containing protein [Bacteriovorax sp.]|nr:DUF2178 domain-containing protein [Bacteriovorax sp.]